MTQFAEAENKGQYCKFVQAADGSYVLKPVKVPAHIIAEREERIRKREIRRHAEENRRRAESLNGSSVFFMVVIFAFFALICCAFLALQNQVTVRSAEITSLQTQVSNLKEDNDMLQKRLETAGDLSTIEEIASEKLGMCYVSEAQIEYYTVEESDYMLQYDDIR